MANSGAVGLREPAPKAPPAEPAWKTAPLNDPPPLFPPLAGCTDLEPGTKTVPCEICGEQVHPIPFTSTGDDMALCRDTVACLRRWETRVYAARPAAGEPAPDRDLAYWAEHMGPEYAAALARNPEPAESAAPAFPGPKAAELDEASPAEPAPGAGEGAAGAKGEASEAPAAQEPPPVTRPRRRNKDGKQQ
jgi:hypothetical protein